MKKQYYLSVLTLLSMSNLMPAMDNKEKKATHKVALLAKGKIGIALKKKELKKLTAIKKKTPLKKMLFAVAGTTMAAAVLGNPEALVVNNQPLVANLLEAAPAPEKPHYPKPSKQNWQKIPHVKSQQNKAVHQPR